MQDRDSQAQRCAGSGAGQLPIGNSPSHLPEDSGYTSGFQKHGMRQQMCSITHNIANIYSINDVQKSFLFTFSFCLMPDDHPWLMLAGTTRSSFLLTSYTLLWLFMLLPHYTLPPHFQLKRPGPPHCKIPTSLWWSFLIWLSLIILYHQQTLSFYYSSFSQIIY